MGQIPNRFGLNPGGNVNGLQLLRLHRRIHVFDRSGALCLPLNGSAAHA
jgi:hypothetical protein